jgi:transposase InsO family protein
VEARTRATSTTAEAFLEALTARMPFAVKAIQVDGGSEYAGGFEAACQRRGIQLFTLPPRSPKLNGHVERAHRTHREEFYEVTDVVWTVAELNRALRTWETIYNTVRPHQALGYLTPQQFLEQWQDHSRKGEVSTI